MNFFYETVSNEIVAKLVHQRNQRRKNAKVKNESPLITKSEYLYNEFLLKLAWLPRRWMTSRSRH